MIEKLFQEYVFSEVYEIGTHKAGLTLLLAMCAHRDTLIHSFDIDDLVKPDTRSLLSRVGVFLHKADVFSPNTEKYLSDLIDSRQCEHLKARKLIVCDGGNKIREFNTFAKAMHTGDVIMAHDYFDSKEAFEKAKEAGIWNWHEIAFSDIEGTCHKEKIRPITEIPFHDAAWFCGIKM